MRIDEAVSKRSAALRRRRLSERTIAWYEMWLRDLSGALLLQDVELVSLDDLRRWVDGLIARSLATESIRGAVTCARAFFGWCVHEEIRSDNPAQRLERPKREKRLPKALSDNEVLALINAAAQTKHPERDVAIVTFLTETGVRVGELVSLTVDRVNVDALFAEVKGKTGPRLAPFNTAAQKTLRAWLAVRSSRLSTLFGLTEWGVRLLLKRLAVKAHIEPRRVHPHVFRHTSVVLRVEGGGEAADLMNIYGWSSASMFSVYAQLAHERLARRAAATSPLDRLLNARATDTK